MRAFFPTLDAEQLIETYAVLGGMPRNLLALDPQRSLMRNIEREVLDPAGSLFSEVRLLLHEELKGEVDAFSRVLEAIPAGNHQRQELAAAANLSLASAQHYLNDLVTNGLVEHRLPLNRVRDEGRVGTYHILDPFLRFWHRWAAPPFLCRRWDRGGRAAHRWTSLASIGRIIGWSSARRAGAARR